MSAHKWQFSARFRRSIFGWRSQVPIQRIREAVSEIRKISRKEPALGAEGAVLFLEKISPALEHVDSSSGAIGSAVNRAIETLTPLITKPVVSAETRQQWMERLWAAIEQDNMPYIEYLADFWGDLCVTPELASFWADQFIHVVRQVWSKQTTGYSYFKGTTACLSALYTAKRYKELLNLLEHSDKWWDDRRWGVQALVAMGQAAEALQYAKDSRGINTPIADVARVCEDILLSMGKVDEAYASYALTSNQSTTNLATFRTIVKKYPQKLPAKILNDLIKSQPGDEGKWFAAAKDAGLFDLAIKLVSKHPADPRTLTRAAKDFACEKPAFAIASGIASLHWIIHGYGYDITSADVIAAYSAIQEGAKSAGLTKTDIHKKINELLMANKTNSGFVEQILRPYLKEGI